MTDSNQDAEEITKWICEHAEVCGMAGRYVAKMSPAIQKLLIRELRTLGDPGKPFNPSRVTGLLLAHDIEQGDAPQEARQNDLEMMLVTMFGIIASVRPNLAGITDLSHCHMVEFTLEEVGKEEDPSVPRRDFSHATIYEGSFLHSELALTRWSASKIDEALFSHCDLDGACMDGAHVEHSRFEYTTMDRTTAEFMAFYGCHFSDCRDIRLLVNNRTVFLDCTFARNTLEIMDVGNQRSMPMFIDCRFDDCDFMGDTNWVRKSSGCLFNRCTTSLGRGSSHKTIGKIEPTDTTKRVVEWIVAKPQPKD